MASAIAIFLQQSPGGKQISLAVPLSQGEFVSDVGLGRIIPRKRYHPQAQWCRATFNCNGHRNQLTSITDMTLSRAPQNGFSARRMGTFGALSDDILQSITSDTATSEEKEAARLLRAAEIALGLDPDSDTSTDEDGEGSGEGSSLYRRQIGTIERLLRQDRAVMKYISEGEDAVELADLLRTRLEESLMVSVPASSPNGRTFEGTVDEAGEDGSESQFSPRAANQGSAAAVNLSDYLVLSHRSAACIIESCLAAGNTALAGSILEACRAAAAVPSFAVRGSPADVLRFFPTADVRIYGAMVRGLAALLRVSDAVTCVEEVARRGVPESSEVSFGQTIDCPLCRKPFAVIQPQVGRQVSGCVRCKYEYELVSGDLVSCESESLIDGAPMLDRVLRFVRLKNSPQPVATHAVVLRSPNGTSQINTFATVTPSVPAQAGERITITCAAPSFASEVSSTLRPASSSSSSPPSSSSSPSSPSSPSFSSQDSYDRARRIAGIFPAPARRAPGWRPSEAMALTNHVTGQVLSLLRAPPKSARDSGRWSFPSWLLPLGGTVIAANVVAASTFGTSLISGTMLGDPTVTNTVALIAASTAAAGGVVNTVVLPRLRQLPDRLVSAMEARQKLLEQHAQLQSRLQGLTQAANEEVRMLARMCQLQSKMQSLGQPSTYGARLERVIAARQGLDQRLQARLALVDSYARISSMIEIEVEMDAEVPTAEAAGAAANIADQIERLMEVESLQQEWRLQAEAKDDVERLLRSFPQLPDLS